jgi:starch synthase
MAKRILYISQEITPYLPETEMSTIARNLPQGIQDHGKEIRTFMPRFGCINERRNQLHEVIRLSGMNLIIDENDHPLIIKVASIQAARMQVYFIDNEDFFHRKHTLQDKEGKFFADNDERAMFFTRGVIETVKKLQWAPDLIHCHGWFTSLIPIYIKQYYHDDPLFQKSKLITSVYNTNFNTPLNFRIKDKLGSDGLNKKDLEILTNPTHENFVKLAINFSDAVINGSKEINHELDKHTDEKGIPHLGFQDVDSYVGAYNDFYDKVLE